MEKDRLLAFSDGVIAVIITIMVLELKAPHDASLTALAQATPVFLSYVLSFVYLAIYWNNHHHFFHLVRHVNGAILWANLHLLFWLSLVPFATNWVGEHSASRQIYHRRLWCGAADAGACLVPAAVGDCPDAGQIHHWRARSARI